MSVDAIRARWAQRFGALARVTPAERETRADVAALLREVDALSARLAAAEAVCEAAARREDAVSAEREAHREYAIASEIQRDDVQERLDAYFAAREESCAALIQQAEALATWRDAKKGEAK